MNENSPIPSSRFPAWQRIAVAAGSAVVLALAAWGIVAYAERHQIEAEAVTAPHPIATTTPVAPGAFMDLPLIGESAIVYDLSTGTTLYAKSADRQLPLASLTKLLSVYAGVQSLSPQTPVTISPSALAAEGESGLFMGETFAFADLARFALAASSNDAAAAITEAVVAQRGSSTRQAMAGAAAAAGLSKTYAINGTGLDLPDLSASGGYGTARDVALLAGALIEEAPELAAASTRPSVSITSANGIPHTLPNTNQGAITVPGVLLSKTGFTDLAGGNLVVVFDAGIDHPVAVVVLGSTVEGRFSDVNRLIDATHQYFAGIPETGAGQGTATGPSSSR